MTVASATSLLVNEKSTKKPKDAVKAERVMTGEHKHSENDSQHNIKLEERVLAANADVRASFIIKSELGQSLMNQEPVGDNESWHRLCSTQELSCKLTLASGQVFSWKFHAHLQEWSGVIGDSVFAMRERGQCVEFRCLHPMECALHWLVMPALNCSIQGL